MKIAKSVFPIFLLVAACSATSCGRGPGGIRGTILDGLKRIESYEMKVVFYDSVTDPSHKKDSITECLTIVRYKKPNLLSIKAEGRITVFPDNKPKLLQNLRVYTTFDGSIQRSRFAAESGEKSSIKSVQLDLSINDRDQPFNGWNLKGFGLLEGKDYIGTVESLVEQYDFTETGRSNNVAILSGTLNPKRCAKMLRRDLPGEDAEYVAEAAAKLQKTMTIRFDNARGLVVGFNVEERSGSVVSRRLCRFDEIKINPAINRQEFVFEALPNEKFTDITADARRVREAARKIRKGGKQ